MKRNLWMLIFAVLLVTVTSFPNSVLGAGGVRYNVAYYTELDYPPYKFNQHGYPSGFDLELTRMVFEDDRYSIYFTFDTWDASYDRLKKEEIDTVGLMAVMDSRKDDLLYSKPVMRTYAGVYAREYFDDEVTVETLSNYTVGVAAGQYTEQQLKEKVGLDSYSTFPTVEEGLKALREGSIDLLFENQQVVNYLMVKEGLNEEIRQVMHDLYPVDIAYGVSKGSPDLVNYINQRIDDLRGEENYEELYEKYFFKHSDFYGERIRNRYILAGCVLVLLIALSYVLLKLYINRLRRTIYGEKEFSKDVLDHTNLFIWAVQGDKTILRFNKYAEWLTGIKEADAVGMRYDNLPVLKERYCELFALLDDALTMKFADDREMTLECADGSPPKVFLFRSATIRGLSGDPDVFIVAGVDIQERKTYENKLQSSYQELEATYEELAATQEELELQFDELIKKEDKLRISEERFRLATLGSGAVIWDTVPDSDYYFVSDRMFELLGYDRIEVPHSIEGWKMLVHPDDLVDAMERRQDYLNGKTPVYECEYRMRKKDDSYIWIEARGRLRKNSEGQIVRFAGSLIDITDRKESELRLQQSYQDLEAVCEELTAAQEELRINYEQLLENQEMLRRNEERYRLVTEASNGGIWEIDLVRKRYYYSQRWFELLGYSYEDHVTSEMITDIIHPDDMDNYEREMEAAIDNRKSLFECEYRLRTKNGEYRWFQARGKIVFNETGEACRFTGSITDIHELKLSQQRLQHLAYYDALSDLPNRLYLLEELEAVFSRPDGKAALFFVDTDNFKYINDTLGHKFGDRLLMDVSARLSGIIGEEGTLFRLGGDEFVILMKDMERKEQAVELADRLLEGFYTPFHIHDSDLYVSVSIGISYYPQDGQSAEEILKNADVAMYAAKEAGKGKYMVFDPSFLQAFNERVQLEKYLRQGLQNDEFLLHYQPQLSLKTGRINGFESLIRWNSPELGFVSPLTFIKVAEDSRLIVSIGEWVILQSCMFAKRLQDEGHGTYKIAVNISVIQLLQDNFVDKVMAALEMTGLEPQYLELEITESTIVESFDRLIQNLFFLRSKGIQIALDDFGTGYSSLGYLKQLPITTLKIDKTFIEQVPKDDDNRSLARAIVLIGRKMGLQVVAEGVETEEQMLHVKRAKCDVIQGYYISKPLPEEEAIRLLRSNPVYDISGKAHV
ncbi:EAL domain-containing protein [Fontibacillus sp. BL9]|uniref:EAL domain-containing protein n=1 Tax=Fontibacillus sp. BL9 TaxID=3389971 RepID=UPI00397D070E